MLQLLYPSLMTKLSTPPFWKKFCKNSKKDITLITYLLPCPAARVPVTSSRRWGTVGFGTAFNRVQLILALSMNNASSRLRTGQRRSFRVLTIC